MKRRAALAVAAFTAALLSACYPTTIRSGRPALPSSETKYWHHAFVFGFVEGSGPYPLDQICPDGWSEFYTEMTAFHGILRIFTAGLYAPAQVHIVCAAPPGVDVNSVSEGPLPRLRIGAASFDSGDVRANAADAGAPPAER